MINLTGPRAKVATIMSDTCGITRGVPDSSDAVLDRDTGLLMKTAPTNVYSGAALFLKKSNPSARENDGAESAVVDYRLSIPWDAPDVHIGDHASMTTCGDASMVGRTMLVTNVGHTGLLVWRQLVVQLLESDRG